MNNIVIFILIIFIILIICYNFYEKFENMMEYENNEKTIKNYIYRIFKKPYRFPFSFKTSFPIKSSRYLGNYLIN